MASGQKSFRLRLRGLSIHCRASQPYGRRHCRDRQRGQSQRPGNCSWNAATTTSWITITAGGSGSGNGTVNFTVAANSTGLPRAGTLVVAGQTVTVSQETPGLLLFHQPDFPGSSRRRGWWHSHHRHHSVWVRVDRRRAMFPGSASPRARLATATAP